MKWWLHATGSNPGSFYLNAFSWLKKKKKMQSLSTLSHAESWRRTGSLVCFPINWSEVQRDHVICLWCHYLKHHMRWICLGTELEWSQEAFLDCSAWSNCSIEWPHSIRHILYFYIWKLLFTFHKTAFIALLWL